MRPALAVGNGFVSTCRPLQGYQNSSNNFKANYVPTPSVFKERANAFFFSVEHQDTRLSYLSTFRVQIHKLTCQVPSQGPTRQPAGQNVLIVEI